MDLNIFLFNTVKTKIGHIRVRQAQIVFKYVPSNIPVSMAREEQKHCIKPVFLILQFQKYCKIGKAPKVPTPITLCRYNKLERHLKQQYNTNVI